MPACLPLWCYHLARHQVVVPVRLHRPLRRLARVLDRRPPQRRRPAPMLALADPGGLPAARAPHRSGSARGRLDATGDRGNTGCLSHPHVPSTGFIKEMLAKGKKKSWQKYVQEIYCPQNWVRPQRMATAGTFLVKILQLTLAQISTLSGRGEGRLVWR